MSRVSKDANTHTIGVEHVKVLSSPFSYVHVNMFEMTLEKHSNDPDDITMNLNYDILTGEWLSHEHHDLVLAIDSKSVPKELLLRNEKVMHPTTSFLNLNRKHKFYSVNNEKVVVSQPYVTASGSVTMSVRLAAHKYALTQLTSPPLKNAKYTGLQIDVKSADATAKLSDKYQLSSKTATQIYQSDCGVDLGVTLGGHEARKVLTLSGLNVGLRVLGGVASHVNLALSLDQFPSLIVSKESKSMRVKVLVRTKKLWSNEKISEKTITARLSIYKDSNELRLEHIDDDVKNLIYLTPGNDYEISLAEAKINYY